MCRGEGVTKNEGEPGAWCDYVDYVTIEEVIKTRFRGKVKFMKVSQFICMGRDLPKREIGRKKRKEKKCRA